MAKADNFAKARSKEEIARIATAWREAFGFRDSWSPDMLHIVENLLPELDSDFALIVKPREKMRDELGYTSFQPPQIWLREDIYERAIQNDGQARFTIGHELGHFLMHSGEARPRKLELVDERVVERFRSSEWQADQFAAAFLMPAHIVKQFASKFELAHCCNVSITAAENRLRELGVFKERRTLPPIVQEYLEQTGKRPKRPDPKE